MSAVLSPSCVWRTTPALIVALSQSLGDPDDGYVNGSQVWIRELPDGVALEWRLHPVAGLRSRPFAASLLNEPGSHHELFATIATAIEAGFDSVAPDSIWDGLECFPAYDDVLEPAELAEHAHQTIGIYPEAFGLVDHDLIGDRWAAAGGNFSVIHALLAQLQGH